ncbi:MAG: VWA domain-containing protein [Lunatimonas sp.]|uniref:vWA domain-containing protein n=1 Tax=Lunatimonas sp. TaxID=2060141 RepID=UPI00263BB120|nr:VWA domain-containing protein [Lunatimonas sp.]MCC5937312.1 VWA domain-containing protein [Lunatimonas sp.]
MKGFRFTKFVPEKDPEKNTFDQLLDVFLQLATMTGGDVSEALSWLTNLDNRYGLTRPGYGIGDFIEDLKSKGYLEEKSGKGEFKITGKSEQTIRRSALEEIFGKLKKGRSGNHKTTHTGPGEEAGSDRRPFQFGDNLDQIALTDSLRNAQVNHGFSGDFLLTEDDLEVVDKEVKTQTSTVLMIDISHSMILYGEDRITPAKKVAMALAELIKTRYPKDTLDVIVFGNDAWQIEIKDLPYLQVGPYHTNTVAGLELAMDLLRRRKNPNKQIFMITDGKPTCLKVGIKYYKNAFGIDSKILKETLKLAAQCRRLKIPVTTFMIASDPYLKEFVKEFTTVNNGNAYYSSLKGLGHLIFEDYRRNRTKRF